MCLVVVWVCMVVVWMLGCVVSSVVGLGRVLRLIRCGLGMVGSGLLLVLL